MQFPEAVQQGSKTDLAEQLGTFSPPSWLRQAFQRPRSSGVPVFLPSEGFAFCPAKRSDNFLESGDQPFFRDPFRPRSSATLKSVLEASAKDTGTRDFDGSRLSQHFWYYPDHCIGNTTTLDWICVLRISHKLDDSWRPGTPPCVVHSRARHAGFELQIFRGKLHCFELCHNPIDGRVFVSESDLQEAKLGADFPEKCSTIREFVDTFLKLNPSYQARRWPLAPIQS